MEVELTLKEAYYGVEKEIDYFRPKDCKKCNATGAENGKIRTCPVCQGKGESVTKEGLIGVRGLCKSCEGKGYFYISECKSCEGKGYFEEKEKRKVTVPRGISGGELVEMEMGDGTKIYLKFVVKGEMEFIRHESDLYYKLDITLEEVLMGSDQELQYFNEIIKFKVSPYSRHKDLIIIKGAGFPLLNSDKNGDLVVELNMIYPKITEELKKALSNAHK